jgi:hypothetical protein
MDPPIVEKKSGIGKYAAGFLFGVGLTAGIVYFGHQTSREPEVATAELEGSKEQYLIVKDFIFNNPPGIIWSKKDNFYLSKDGMFLPLSRVEKLEDIKMKVDQEARRNKLTEKAEKYIK